MKNILLSAGSSASDHFFNNKLKSKDSNEKSLFCKNLLSNGMEIFDFDENIIIAKMEKMMQLLDEAL